MIKIIAEVKRKSPAHLSWKQDITGLAKKYEELGAVAIAVPVGRYWGIEPDDLKVIAREITIPLIVKWPYKEEPSTLPHELLVIAALGVSGNYYEAHTFLEAIQIRQVQTPVYNNRDLHSLKLVPGRAEQLVEWTGRRDAILASGYNKDSDFKDGFTYLVGHKAEEVLKAVS